MHDAPPRPALALVIATQALLATQFVVGVAAIALLPAFSADVAASLPEYAELRTPLLAATIALIVLALIVLAMAALLVHRIRRGTVLTRSSLLWVDVIVASLVCAVTLVIVASTVIGDGQAGSPFLALVQIMAGLGLIALACITLVLRSLLRHAILIRAELDEVV